MRARSSARLLAACSPLARRLFVGQAAVCDRHVDSEVPCIDETLDNRLRGHTLRLRQFVENVRIIRQKMGSSRLARAILG